MSRPLPRYTNTTQRDQAAVDKAVGNTNPHTWHITHQPNPQNLRGIPVQTKGVGGTSPHTDPLSETIHRNP